MDRAQASEAWDRGPIPRGDTKIMNKAEDKNETIVFGGGCFWCTEAVFKMLRGVISVEPGYAGGTAQNPTYEDVCGGKTGHAEVVKIEYNPEEADFRDLLAVFFGSHDPTTKDRQGNDIGTQYRSVIFYTTPEQKEATEKFIKNIDGIVTTVEPLNKFYPAENYHKDYFKNNPSAAYCQLIINPKLQKVQGKFKKLLKDNKK